MYFNIKLPEGMKFTIPVIYICAICAAHHSENCAFDLVVPTISFEVGTPLFIWAGSAQIYGRYSNK